VSVVGVPGDLSNFAREEVAWEELLLIVFAACLAALRRQ
jgi:hypothetical protein